MLDYLHVKNLALIEETEVSFYPGLNILTGETGAGKSLLLGSVNLALGAKAGADIIRSGAEFALVELSFSVHHPKVRQALAELDIYPEDGEVLISRKIMRNRSISRINGENVTVALLKKAAGLLLDIHGQHEHQSLLYPARQLDILDEYAGESLAGPLQETREAYRSFTALEKELAGYTLSESDREREKSFLQFEMDEIENAGLYEGEEEELEAAYRRMNHARSIAEALGTVHALTGYEDGAGDRVGRALQELSGVLAFDDSLKDLYDSLADAEGMLSEVNRQASDYLENFSFSEEDFRNTENRLDEIRRLMTRYGSTVGKIFESLEERKARMAFLENYEEQLAGLNRKKGEAEDRLKKASADLSRVRKAAAKRLSAGIAAQLAELNFNRVAFDIAFSEKESYSPSGTDGVEFLISTNPGEDMRPLAKVASGGELSRIMLAIKTLLAEEDETEALIFDEIDSGISGRTAQMVSEKMAAIGRNHQVICITHLAQIAAMADTHFLIEKKVENDRTVTDITVLDGEQSVEELARILGGAKITDAVRKSAEEMKKLALDVKKSIG